MTDQLAKEQGKHIKTLERWGKKQHKVCGVPVVQMLNYDLIQALNNIYLQNVLSEEAQTDG